MSLFNFIFSGKVGYMNKTTERVVFCEENFVLTCETSTGVHTVYRAEDICRDDAVQLVKMHNESAEKVCCLGCSVVKSILLKLILM